MRADPSQEVLSLALQVRNLLVELRVNMRAYLNFEPDRKLIQEVLGLGDRLVVVEYRNVHSYLIVQVPWQIVLVLNPIQNPQALLIL